jgi:hypothetical protein
MHFAAVLHSCWTLSSSSNSEQNTAFKNWLHFHPVDERWRGTYSDESQRKSFFSNTFSVTPNTIHISHKHKHHKHDKAYYSCSYKCYPQNELLKFTVCLLVLKIMPQYLRQSNMKLTTSDMFPLVKCLQYEKSDVVLILVPAVHTSRWFSKYSMNTEQLILCVFIYDNHPY